MDDINLGDKVKDTITGYTGVVTGLATYLHSAAAAQVTSAELKDGATVEEWINVGRLTKV
jgi:hypothetical protein